MGPLHLWPGVVIMEKNFVVGINIDIGEGYSYVNAGS